MAKTTRWSIAVFTARESAEALHACAAAIVRACAGRPATIDLVVNGNAALAHALASGPTIVGAGQRLRVWSIALADKAHAWNEYLYRIAPREGLAFFVDGNVRVRPDALARLQAVFTAEPGALAATAVPTSGRSADAVRRELLVSGGLHGNLYALPSDTMAALRERRFRLPLGLYRNDSLIGAALAFGLDPSLGLCDFRRIAVAADATCDFAPLRWWSMRDIAAQWRRMERQAQGVLENRAVHARYAIAGMPIGSLPETVTELIDAWVAGDPDAARALLRRTPLCRAALRRVRRPRDWSAARRLPMLVADRADDASAPSGGEPHPAAPNARRGDGLAHDGRAG